MVVPLTREREGIVETEEKAKPGEWETETLKSCTGRTSYEVDLQRANSKPYLFSSGGSPGRLELMHLKYSYKWNRKLSSSRQLFIYLNHFLSLKYKGCTHCLSTWYFIYSTVAYVIYFSKIYLSSELFLKYIYLLLSFWKYMS